MNILLINHYAGSPRHGMEYRPYFLAREWTKLGHKVRVIAASESHLRQHNPTLTDKVFSEVIDGIDYLWLKTPAYKHNGIARVVNMLFFSMRLLTEKKQILNNFKPDIVIASSPQPFIIRGAKRLAQQTKAKLIYEVRDLWPLSLIELLGISRFHPLILLMQLEENYAYKHADKVASLLPKAQEHMSAHGLDPKKFIYTPNGINVKSWGQTKPLPTQIETELKKIKQRKRPIIAYTGTHGMANALDLLLDVAKLGAKQFEVILVGDGPERSTLLKRVEQESITNVTLLPAIPKASIPVFLQEIDIAYISLVPHPLFRFGISPNKLMDYMMSAKPIIMAIDAGNDPVTESACGISCKAENAAEIYKAIRQLTTQSQKNRQAMGEAGQRYVKKHHDYAALAKKYLEAI